MRKEIEFSFDIPNTPEMAEARAKLEEEFENGSCVLYRQMADGKMVPIMNVSKHPDCPDGMYVRTLKALLKYNEALQ